MISAIESKVLDANSEALGISTLELMENAGRTVADNLEKMFKPSKVLVVCGTGNNGGDGAVTARHLFHKGWKTTLALVKSRKDLKSKALVQKLKVLPKGVKVVECAKPGLADDYGIIVDAMLGTGLSEKPKEPYASWIKKLNASKAKIVSIDVPSGMGTSICVKPDVTVTLHDSKLGMNLANSGNIIVADIGIPKEAMEFTGPGEFVYYPIPDKSSHKGQNGRLLIVGGGPYAGAPALSAMAALAAGADLVWIAAPEKTAGIIACYTPNYIVKGLEGDVISSDNLKEIDALARNVDALLVGPGLGRDKKTLEAVSQLVKKCKLPLVIDADGLYALSVNGVPAFKTPTVLTPHRREFSRLTGIKPNKVSEKDVVKLAGKCRCVVLLKGPVDFVTDGERVKKNTTGNPAMTVGGTGDVLAGIVAGLMAKGVKSFEAARMGAYLSGVAGDRAFGRIGYSLTATEVIASIPLALMDSLNSL
jgi:hydroxyethylthiazole kinase-like uncharacterized protein yjeF